METHEKEVLSPGSNAGNGAFFGTCDGAGSELGRKKGTIRGQ